MNIVIPYSMIEPIRELLDAVTSDRGEVDDRWQESLRKEVMRSDVPLHSVLVEKVVNLKDVMQFKEGDIIPIDMPDSVVLMAEDVPVFRGKLGVSDGNYAIQIEEKLTQDSI